MPRTHKTLKRLFVENPLAGGEVIQLDKNQSNYLLNVLRSREGDRVIVFNGLDGAWVAEIGMAGKKLALLTLVEQTLPQPAAADLWYGFAPLKTGRLDYMIQKATEMGAGTIQPVITQYTQNSHPKPDRMRANAIEAAEQCEILDVPEIADEIALPKLLEAWPETHSGRVLIFADERESSASPVEALEAIRGQKVGVLVGPEGGFSDEERELLRRQDFVLPISLGPRILRADTAAVAALAVIQSIIGDWR